MKRPKPPALATWLIEHLNGGSSEALAGDLLEQFSQGRSIAWYWRQVLVAISLIFRREWFTVILALAFTAAWAFPVCYGRLWLAPFSVLPPDRPVSWLVSKAYSSLAFSALAIVPVCFAATLYFAMMITRRRTKLTEHKFLAGTVKGCIAAALSTFLLSLVLPAHRDPELVGNAVATLPVFFGTLVVLWSLRPYRIDKGKPIFPGSPFIGT